MGSQKQLTLKGPTCILCPMEKRFQPFPQMGYRRTINYKIFRLLAIDARACLKTIEVTKPGCRQEK